MKPYKLSLILVLMFFSCNKDCTEICNTKECVDWSEFYSTALLNGDTWDANFTAYQSDEVANSIYISMDLTNAEMALREQIRFRNINKELGKQSLFHQKRGTLTIQVTSYFDYYAGDGDAISRSFDLIDGSDISNFIEITSISNDTRSIEGTFHLEFSFSKDGPGSAYNTSQDTLIFHEGTFRAYGLE